MQNNSSKETGVSVFTCTITLPSGKQRTIEAKLPDKIKPYGKGRYKGIKGYLFEIDLAKGKHEIYTPAIDFKLYKKNRKEFEKNFISAYLQLIRQENIDLLFDEDIARGIKYTELQQEKEFYKQKWENLIAEHKKYFPEYREIYKPKKHEWISSLTEEELKFIKDHIKPPKKSRYTAFLVLLYRHKDQEKFPLRCNLSDDTALKELFEWFYASFRKEPK